MGVTYTVMKGNKRENILRIILTEPELSKNELSKRANCVRSWVIRFLNELEKKKLVKGTKVIKPEELFRYWLSIHKKPKYKSYMIKNPLKLLQKAKLDYAVTTYKAENLVQKYLFPSKIDVYILEKDLEEWHKLLVKEGLVGGGNFRLLIADKDVMIGKRKLNNLWIVSIPQLIVDLLTEGAMCAEAAEMLIKRNYHALKNY